MIERKDCKVGQVVHIDTDNAQWGRVATDATIIEVRKKALLVNAHSIRANIIVPLVDATATEQPN